MDSDASRSCRGERDSAYAQNAHFKLASSVQTLPFKTERFWTDRVGMSA